MALRLHMILQWDALSDIETGLRYLRHAYNSSISSNMHADLIYFDPLYSKCWHRAQRTQHLQYFELPVIIPRVMLYVEK